MFFGNQGGSYGGGGYGGGRGRGGGGGGYRGGRRGMRPHFASYTELMTDDRGGGGHNGGRGGGGGGRANDRSLPESTNVRFRKMVIRLGDEEVSV